MFTLLKVHNFERTESTQSSLTFCHSAMYFIRDPWTQSSKQYCFFSLLFITFTEVSASHSVMLLLLFTVHTCVAFRFSSEMRSSADCLHAVIRNETQVSVVFCKSENIVRYRETGNCLNLLLANLPKLLHTWGQSFNNVLNSCQAQASTCSPLALGD